MSYNNWSLKSNYKGSLKWAALFVSKYINNLIGMASELHIQALDKSLHDRASFDCAVSALNDYDSPWSSGSKNTIARALVAVITETETKKKYFKMSHIIDEVAGENALISR